MTHEDALALRRCGYCEVEDRHTIIFMDSGSHWAKLECVHCKRFIDWVKKPENESDSANRPAAHRKLVKKFSKGFCEMCLIPESELPPGEALEVQHVDQFKDDGEATRENVWILCTACHRFVHWRRTHVGHMLKLLAKWKVPNVAVD